MRWTFCVMSHVTHKARFEWYSLALKLCPAIPKELKIVPFSKKGNRWNCILLNIDLEKYLFYYKLHTFMCISIRVLLLHAIIFLTIVMYAEFKTKFIKMYVFSYWNIRRLTLRVHSYYNHVGHGWTGWSIKCSFVWKYLLAILWNQ